MVWIQIWDHKYISGWDMKKLRISQSLHCIDTESNCLFFCIYRNAVDGNKKLYAIYDTR